VLAFELEADGFTHLSCTCISCGKVQLVSFAQARTKLDISIWPLTAAQIGEAMRCQRCPSEAGMTAEPVKAARTYRGGPMKRAPTP
jgi:hypothetical protein